MALMMKALLGSLTILTIFDIGQVPKPGAI